MFREKFTLFNIKSSIFRSFSYFKEPILYGKI